MGALCSHRGGTVLVVLLALGFVAGGAALASGRRMAALEMPLLVWFTTQPGADDGRVGPVRLEGRLRRDATPREFGVVLELAVVRVGQGEAQRPVAGRVRLSVGGAEWASQRTEWRAGRIVRVSATLRRPDAYRNPGTGDREKRWVLRGTPLVGSVKSGLLVDVLCDGRFPAELAAAARGTVRAAVDRSVGRFGQRSAAVVTAVLVGDRAGLDHRTIRRLQEGGTYHVIAISGGNIAILAGCLVWLGRIGGLRPRPLALSVMVALVAYVSVVGPEPSVIRATGAAVVVLGASLLGQRSSPLNVLGVTAIGVGLFSPLAVLDPGFLLTYGATLGIVLGASRLAAAWESWLRRWTGTLPRCASLGLMLLAATMCAEAVLLPLGVVLFGRVSFAGLLLNFLAIPLMTVSQLAGMAAAVLAMWLPAAALVPGYLAHLAATGLVESTRLLDLCPWLAFRVPPPGRLVLLAYYGGLTMVMCRGGSGRNRMAAQLALVGATVLIVSAGVRPAVGGRPPLDWLRVTFLDVGQADATLIQGPGGRSVLVDAAGSVTGRSTIGERVVVPALWALGVRRLDVAVLTHGHPDHIGGFPAVWQDLAPREVWEGIPVPGLEYLRAARSMVQAAGGRWRQVVAGDRFEMEGLEYQVLHPPLPEWQRVSVRNDDSVTLDVRFGGVGILLPGDISAEVESHVIPSLEPVSFRVVKVPHHGSASSSSPAWVTGTEPCLAVVSAGRSNVFGHPADDVVKRYEDAGALVLVTGRDGAVTVETDGQQVYVWTEGGQRFRFQSGDLECGS